MKIIDDAQEALELAIELDKSYPNYNVELEDYFDTVINSRDNYLIFQWAQRVKTHMDECFDKLKNDNNYLLYWPRNIKTRQDECFRYYMNNLSNSGKEPLQELLEWASVNESHLDEIADYISNSRTKATASSAVIFAEKYPKYMQTMFDTLCKSYDITDDYSQVVFMWLRRPMLMQNHDLLSQALMNYYHYIKTVDNYIFTMVPDMTEKKEEFCNILIKYGNYDIISQWLMQVEYENNCLLKIELIKNNQVNKFVKDYKKNCAPSYSVDEFYWNVPDDYKLGVVV